MANYTIIGSDGKEYGPVSEADLQKWIAEGRANGQTQVRLEGATEWRAVSDVPEFAGLPKASLPPLRPLAAGAPLPPAPPAAPKTSVMAICSLILGILGVFTCGGTALFGLILGIIALVQISKNRDQLGGKGLALSGTIVSGVLLLMLPLFIALLLPAFAAAKNRAQQISCMNNERQLAQAVIVYSRSHQQHLPPAATWCDALKDAVPEGTFKCPAALPTSRCDYAFNARLNGVDPGKLDPNTVMIFEGDAGWNASGGPEMVAPPRHTGRVSAGAAKHVIVAFADGHVQSVPAAELGSLRWNP